MERQEQIHRNARALERSLCSKDAGRAYTLVELAALGAAGAIARDCRPMPTITDAEEYAGSRGPVGLFVTLTLPGRFHPVRLGDGGGNMLEPSPCDGQQWLLECWGRVRCGMRNGGAA